MPLPTPFHANHPSYSNYVRNELNLMRANGPISMPQLQSLQNGLRADINQIQGSGNFYRLNDYFKANGY
jgi:hypothetical protein